MKHILWMLAGFLLWHAGHSKELVFDTYQKGNEAYEKGDYQEARHHYEKVLNEGWSHPHLYYNYANSLFRLNELGRAILYYEKAHKLAPTDGDIEANLKFARAQTIDKHPEPEQNLITRILLRLHRFYPLNSALWWTLILFSAVFLIACLSLFLNRNARWLTYPVIGLLIIILVIVLPSVTLRIHEQASSRYAIVLSKSTSLYSGPGDSYETLAKVHEGTRFEIETSSQGWVKVKLPNGTGGFVKESDLGKI